MAKIQVTLVLIFIALNKIDIRIKKKKQLKSTTIFKRKVRREAKYNIKNFIRGDQWNEFFFFFNGDSSFKKNINVYKGKILKEKKIRNAAWLIKAGEEEKILPMQSKGRLKGKGKRKNEGGGGKGGEKPK